MSDNEKFSEVGYVNRCGGIPMYPAEYHFQEDESIKFTENQIASRKIKVAKFLEKYGLKFVDG